MRTKLMVMVIAALALLPGAAHAGVVATIAVPLDADTRLDGYAAGLPGHLVSGPVLAGGGVAWAQDGAGQAIDVDVLGAGGGAPRTVATLPTIPSPNPEHGLRLLGSPTRLAWAESQQDVNDGKYQLYDPFQARVQAGPVAGPFATVAGCDRVDDGSCAQASCFYGPGGYYVLPPAFALAGDTLVVADSCAPAPSSPGAAAATTVRTTDLAAGTAVPVRAVEVPESGYGPAALSTDRVLIQSYGSPPQERSTADGSLLGTLPGVVDVTATALQADGKLAVIETAGPGGGQELFWAAPGDQQMHLLAAGVAMPRARVDILRFAGDQVLYGARRADGGQDLVVSDLAGHARTLVAMPAPKDPTQRGAVLEGADFDGTTATWAVTTCERTAIGVSGAGDAPVTLAPRRCDTPRVFGASATTDRRGRAAIGVLCAKACSGTLAFRDVSYRSTARTRFRLPGSARVQRVALPLTSVLRRALARRHVLHGRAYVQEQPALAERALTVTAAKTAKRR